MKFYKDFDNNVIYTEEEIKTAFEQQKDEMDYDSFESYLDDMLSKGVAKTGGIEEIEVHYLLDLSEYSSTGCAYTQTIETGNTSETLDLEAVAEEYEPENGTWYILEVKYYDLDKDPLFDDPDVTEEFKIA